MPRNDLDGERRKFACPLSINPAVHAEHSSEGALMHPISPRRGHAVVIGASMGLRLFTASATLLDNPWGIVAGGDLRFPYVEGERAAAMLEMDEYPERYRDAAEDDAVRATALLRVIDMLDGPDQLISRAPGAGDPRRRAGSGRRGVTRRTEAYRHPVVCHGPPGPKVDAVASITLDSSTHRELSHNGSSRATPRA